MSVCLSTLYVRMGKMGEGGAFQTAATLCKKGGVSGGEQATEGNVGVIQLSSVGESCIIENDMEVGYIIFLADTSSILHSLINFSALITHTVPTPLL